MIGVLVQLAISWLIVYFIEKKHLGVLGLKPNRTRLIDFFLFLLLAGACCSLGFVLKMIFLDQYWQVNPEITLKLIAEGIWWNINSVLFEELIFRGVLLFIAIQRLGERNGILLSGIAFGIYHWFSFNAFGNIPNMIFIFVYTGVMGLVFAYAFAKSGSLYIPVAIHLGWNVVQQVVFSTGPIGDQLLVRVSPEQGIDIPQAIFFSIQLFNIVFTPPFLFLILRRMNKQERWRHAHD
jgi:uncharacterized protein